MGMAPNLPSVEMQVQELSDDVNLLFWRTVL